MTKFENGWGIHMRGFGLNIA